MKRLLKKLREGRRRRKAEVLYLCDGKACKVCHPEKCLHTTNPAHAKNFCFAYGRVYIEQ